MSVRCFSHEFYIWTRIHEVENTRKHWVTLKITFSRPYNNYSRFLQFSEPRMIIARSRSRERTKFEENSEQNFLSLKWIAFWDNMLCRDNFYSFTFIKCLSPSYKTLKSDFKSIVDLIHLASNCPSQHKNVIYNIFLLFQINMYLYLYDLNFVPGFNLHLLVYLSWDKIQSNKVNLLKLKIQKIIYE